MSDEALAGPSADPMPNPRARRPRHHPIVRATHWISALALVVMGASGLRILNAYPAFAPKGQTFPWWPWEGTPVPDVLTFGAWLGGARHWHFAMMWLLVANGIVYLGLRKRHPVQGKHNALQKYAYSAMIVLGVVSVITGIAIWKPVSLGWLADLMGGYWFARWLHFLAMLLLAVLVVVHVVMVFAVDPYALRAMTTGGYDEARFSPEARNARPFVNLAPARVEDTP